MRPFVHISHVKVQPGFSRVVTGRVAGDSGEQLNRNFVADTLMRPEFIISAVVKTMVDTPGEIESKD